VINQYDSAVFFFKKYIQLLTPGTGYYANQLKYLTHLQALQKRIATTGMENIIKSERLYKEAVAAASKSDLKHFDAANVPKFQESISADKLNPAPLYWLGIYYLRTDWAETFEKVDAAKMATAYNYFVQVNAIDSGYEEIAGLLSSSKYEKESSEAWSKYKKVPPAPRVTYTETTQLYNSANTKSNEIFLTCSKCSGKGEVYNPAGGNSSNTYYLMGGSGLIYQGYSFVPFYTKCDMCNGTGKIRY
jgi:hypothetical protein